MDSYKLSFCKINKLTNSVAEIIVNEGVEMDLAMVREYHRWISENLSSPSGLLVNKVNKYTYTFEAQIQLADLPQIKAMSVITYDKISIVSTKALSNMPRQQNWNLKIFDKRDDALVWLENELSK